MAFQPIVSKLDELAFPQDHARQVFNARPRQWC
jgi:hypothetical protein